MRISHSTGTRQALAFVAGLSVLLAATPAVVLAQKTPYTDVPAGAYYEDAAAGLIEAGALDTTQLTLRPSDMATRAELVKLLVDLRHQQLLYPSAPSFTDVSASVWYAPYFEAAASAGWVRGDNNCYQNSRPCTARPGAPVNRAEAATILTRVFGLTRTGESIQFPDVIADQWYYLPIQTAADHCVLQGDSDTGKVRPSANMNRAEMVVMFYRAYQNQTYGVDCGVPTARLSQVTALSSTQIQVAFTESLNVTRAQDKTRYTVQGPSSSENVNVTSAVLINDRTVKLTLAEDLRANTTYTVNVNNMLSQGGLTFSGSKTVQLSGTAAHLTSATALNGVKLRLTFDQDLDRTRAQDATHYTVTNVGSGSTIGPRSAVLVDNRTVELSLTSSLPTGVSYRVGVENLLTTSGIAFSDAATVSLAPIGTGHIASVSSTDATHILVKYDTDVDSTRSLEIFRYLVTDASHNYIVRSARSIDARTVELTLGESLQAQHGYTVSATNINTSQGASFSDNGVFIYDSQSKSLTLSLTGGQTVPPIITNASGNGTLTLTSSGLQYDITVANMSGSITGAEFHIADAGTVGPLAETISGTGSHLSGTWSNLTTDERNAIVQGRAYVIVKSALHPEGEIRGQILSQ